MLSVIFRKVGSAIFENPLFMKRRDVFLESWVITKLYRISVNVFVHIVECCIEFKISTMHTFMRHKRMGKSLIACHEGKLEEIPKLIISLINRLLVQALYL